MVKLQVSKSMIRVFDSLESRPMLPTFPLMKQKYTAPGVPCYGTMTAAEQWGKKNG